MLRRHARTLLLSLAVFVASCGGSDKVNVSTYTCGDFNSSLDTKDDLSSGDYIRQLNAQAKLPGKDAEQQRKMAYAVFVACRGQKASFKPRERALRNAALMKKGKTPVPADLAETLRKRAAEAKKNKGDAAKEDAGR